MQKHAPSQRMLAILAIVSVSLFAVSRAHADSMDTFTITGPSNYSATFTLPASPTPYGSSTGLFAITPVTIDVNGTTYTDGLAQFLNPSVYYNLAVQVFYNNTVGDYVELYGSSQVFSGTTASPTFLPGMYSYAGVSNPNPDGTYNLDIAASTPTPSPVPEPSSLQLLGTGLLGLAGLIRRQMA
ncbi:MAG: PEP-CTERM sorting domain-containing protein [Acidobacteriaceae bacterium]